MAFAALLFLAASLLAPPAAAAGARPPFQMPFRCGERWEAHTRSGHRAIDWNLGNGSDDLGRRVMASASGIATAKYHGEYGYYVDVDHGGGWVTRYAHLLRSGRVEGPVTQGEQIGLVGSTGSSTAPHMHWEQRANGVPQATLTADGAVLETGGRTYTSRNCLRRDPFLSGDIDGDGDDDLAARFVGATGASRVRTIRARASRSLEAGPTLFLTAANLPSSSLLSLADTNGDGRDDLNAAYRRDGGVQFVSFYGGTDGSFGAKQPRYFGSGWRFAQLSSIRAGDVTGDGVADLAARFVPRSGDSVVRVVAGSARAALTTVGNDVLAAGALPRRAAVALGDTNGDGRDDLNAAYASRGGVVLASFYGRADATFGRRHVRYRADTWPGRRLKTLRVGDTNGSGVNDFVVRFVRRDGGSTLRIVQGGAASSLTTVNRVSLDPSDLPAESQLAAGDTTGDGRADLNVASARPGSDVRFSTFNGTDDATLAARHTRFLGDRWQFHRLC